MIAPAPLASPVSNFGWTAGAAGLVTVASTMSALTVTVVARATAQLGHGVPYEISVELLDPAARCPDAAVSVGESLDNAPNLFTGNDVLAFGMSPFDLPTLTAITTDAPEPFSALVVDQPATVTGSTDGAHAVPPAPETYVDRDTFQVDVPASVSSLDLVLRYDATTNQDLDVWLVRAGDLHQQGIGYNVGPEAVSLDVSPGTYFLTVGQYTTQPVVTQPYTLTLCPRAF
jgi:hypothetical protein